MKARNAEHGLLFTGEMVRALLDGRKTVTRRTSAVWAKRQAGDLLWVRETFQAHALSGAGEPVQIRYRADGATRTIARAPDDATWTEPPRWTPAIHMPRWASRITLRVTSLDRELTAHCNRANGRISHLCHCSSCSFTYDCVALPRVDDAEARLEGVADRAAYLRLWREINGDEYPETLWRIGFEVGS